MHLHKDVNIFDIAKIANVGTSTVSRVINDHPNVSAKTREHVLNVIKEHGYIPNNSARNLSATSSNAIVVIVSGVNNPLFARMLFIIQTILAKNQYSMILHNHILGVDEDIMDISLSLYKEKRPKGILFLGGYFDENHQKLGLLEVPVVMATATIHAECDRSLFSSFTIDDEREAFRVANSIINSGHKRIGMIGNIELRANGFNKALQAHGLSAETISIDNEVAFSYESGYVAAKKLLESGSYSCIFCHSDILAIGAMKAIHEKGLRIPDDISIIGFDGIEASEYTNPTLATVNQPSDEIARRSVSALLNTIITEEHYGHLVLPAKFVNGESFRALEE
ncbi:catabolite control protein A [Bacteroidia bacterium]|nr:catabolite control protein A [Bacteroidia bacterium]